ncbi:hypothetical protein [Flavobacterium sp.]|jgi:hypothetical protein|uniref:hypothetical protein n=1 Tax=Flavobacterium sp. TaxID=239 RepID=UPI003B9C0C59
MKKVLLLCMAVISLISTSACSDDDNSNNGGGNNTTAGFTWRENDPNGTINQAASATFTSQFNTLIAKKADGSTLFEINLSGSSAAAYTLTSSGANMFTYTGENPFFVAESGTVTITSNANNKISGSYEAFRTGNGLTRLYGTFTDVPVN